VWLFDLEWEMAKAVRKKLCDGQRRVGSMRIAMAVEREVIGPTNTLLVKVGGLEKPMKTLRTLFPDCLHFSVGLGRKGIDAGWAWNGLIWLKFPKPENAARAFSNCCGSLVVNGWQGIICPARAVPEEVPSRSLVLKGLPATTGVAAVAPLFPPGKVEVTTTHFSVRFETVREAIEALEACRGALELNGTVVRVVFAIQPVCFRWLFGNCKDSSCTRRHALR
jgi:hypothetical protein